MKVLNNKGAVIELPNFSELLPKVESDD
ncbi:HNH endonuclease, partial [Salmonella enterica]|nr:HNH endonuclease [Salmonella enterica]